MRLEAKKHLEDVRLAAAAALEFAQGKTYEDYCSQAMLRSAVERQFEIMGEALNRLRKSDPALAESIEHCKRIIAFRNILIHGYDVIDDRVVWDVIERDLPALHDRAASLLAQEHDG